MPSSVQNVHKKKLTPKNIADLIDDEVEAIEQYDQALDETDDANEKETIEHIRDEEEEHIKELDGMEKMVDDMDSEQAWEDFKSGYTDFIEQHVSEGQVNKSKDGETSSIEGKLDTLLAIQQEQRVDIERLTDVIPQLKGDIEQQNELEETEEGEEGDPMADLFGGETFSVGRPREYLWEVQRRPKRAKMTSRTSPTMPCNKEEPEYSGAEFQA